MTTNRRLFFHAFVFAAMAPVTGFLIMAPVANPRAMLGFHVALWLSAAIVSAAAAAWPLLALSPKAAAWTERGLIAGFWCGFAIGVVQSLTGTATLFAGGGMAPAWAEGGLKALQLAITFTLAPSLIAMAVGLGKRLAP